MIWLIKLLIFGKCCKHRYEICAEANILDEEGTCMGRLYHCRCPLCGHMKKFEFRVGEG